MKRIKREEEERVVPTRAGRWRHHHQPRTTVDTKEGDRTAEARPDTTTTK
ncbi:hypothetical protein BVRB_1g014950 [Beta vulgaris subsp. vulgaris]|nr:hypothetical protein BVRB_1g014950 [Beta vulgaris subsp. vulgaris]